LYAAGWGFESPRQLNEGPGRWLLGDDRNDFRFAFGAAYRGLVRLCDDPATHAYAARRRADGKSAREIRRCVKRAIARQLFKLLQQLDRFDTEVIRVC
jgi:hypothetical protein